MADYSTLHGILIETIAGDPANPVEGQIWYNSSTNVLKAYNGSSTVTFTTD